MKPLAMPQLEFRNNPFSDVVGLLCFTVSSKSFPILLVFSMTSPVEKVLKGHQANYKANQAK